MAHRDPLGASRAYSAILERQPRWHDTYLRDLLREVSDGCELDVAWIPNKQRMREPTADELRMSPQLAAPVGCWGVIIKFHATVRTATGLLPNLLGVPFICQVPMWSETPHIMDGNFGNPLVPGPWLIDRLCETDRTRHNNLGAKANALRVMHKEHEHREQDQVIRDAAAPDNFFADPLHRAWQKETADDTVTREDEIRLGHIVEKYMDTRARIRHEEVQDVLRPEPERANR